MKLKGRRNFYCEKKNEKTYSKDHTFSSDHHSSTESSDSDIPTAISHLKHLTSRNLRRNSISLPSGLNTIDNEAIQRARIDDKINENVSSALNCINFYRLYKVIGRYESLLSR